MRIFIGGGPRNNRNRSNRGRENDYRIGVSIPLGPVGSAIVSVFIIIIGVILTLSSLGSIFGVAIGIFLIAIGFFCFRSNTKH